MPGSSRWASANAHRGEPGRGAGWVAVQFPLMAAIVAAGWLPPHWPDAGGGARTAAGSAIAAAGGLFALWAVRTLGPSLTPFPRPREDAELVEGGPYAHVRHPIYGGLIAFFAGYGLVRSIPALALTVPLALLWLAKSRVEERWLEQRFPRYGEYRRRVGRRLLPRVL